MTSHLQGEHRALLNSRLCVCSPADKADKAVKPTTLCFIRAVKGFLQYHTKLGALV